MPRSWVGWSVPSSHHNSSCFKPAEPWAVSTHLIPPCHLRAWYHATPSAWKTFSSFAWFIIHIISHFLRERASLTAQPKPAPLQSHTICPAFLLTFIQITTSTWDYIIYECLLLSPMFMACLHQEKVNSIQARTLFYSEQYPQHLE